MDYSVEVVVEEDIYAFEAANNGAGPLWCHGSTIVARWKDGLYVVVLETLEDHVPLNNCRWVLYHRDQSGWQRVHADDTGRTREPSPLVILDDGVPIGDVLVTVSSRWLRNYGRRGSSGIVVGGGESGRSLAEA